MTTNIPLQYHLGPRKVSSKLMSSRAQITARPAQAISSPGPPASSLSSFREFPSQPLQSVMEKPLKLWMFVIFSANAEVGVSPAYLILLISLGLSKHMLQEKDVSTCKNLLIAQKKAM